MKTTATDKILRELNIIEAVFQSQFSPIRIDPNINLVDEKGDMLTTGRFINQINVFSDQELFNIQEFKRVITERFETVQNPALLKNQLIEVYNKALKVRDLFNENLTSSSDVFKRFKHDIDERKKAELKVHPREKFSWIEYYSAAVTVYNNFLGVIYFGRDSIIRGKELEFRYLLDNYTLASICQSLIEFIDKFEIIPTTSDGFRQISSSSILDLKGQFIDKQNYSVAIEKLINAGIVVEKTKTQLIFKPYRRSAKYEVIELFLAMQNLGLINEMTESKMVIVASNTFEDLSLTDRTARSKSIGNNITRYEAILS